MNSEFAKAGLAPITPENEAVDFATLESNFMKFAAWVNGWIEYQAPDHRELFSQISFLIPDADQRKEFIKEFYQNSEVSVGVTRAITNLIHDRLRVCNYPDDANRAAYIYDYAMNLKVDRAFRSLYCGGWKDQPALEFLGLMDLVPMSGAYRHGNDSHACKMAKAITEFLGHAIDQSVPNNEFSKVIYYAGGPQSLLARHRQFE